MSNQQTNLKGTKIMKTIYALATLCIASLLPNTVSASSTTQSNDNCDEVVTEISVNDIGNGTPLQSGWQCHYEYFCTINGCWQRQRCCMWTCNPGGCFWYCEWR